MKNDFKNVSDVRYLTPKEIEFYETEGELLGAKVDGEDVGRVDVLKLFPLHKDFEFLSIRRQSVGRRDRDTEEGIIEDLNDFSPEQFALVKKELNKRYFIPELIKVTDAKEEFGHTYWEAQTSAGNRSFTTFDMSASLVRVSEKSIMLIDVDGNRYFAKDVYALGDKALKVLDAWL